MIKAYPEKDGKYRLVGDRSSETYSIREEIKNVFGVWNADLKCWSVPESSLDLLPVAKMVKVKVSAHCHMPEEEMYVTEYDFNRGETMLGCPLCDVPDRYGKMVKILNKIEQTIK